jgi:hypothetical protein
MKSHDFRGHLRPEGEVGDILATSNGFKMLHRANPKAGESMHSKIGWKSILAKHDELAISDPKMLKKVSDMEKRLK